MKFHNLVSALLILTVVGVVSCGKKNNDSDTRATPYYPNNYSNSNSYTFGSDGQCYSSGGQIVQSTYCNSTGFTMNGDVCYSSTGQVASNTYCNNNFNNNQFNNSLYGNNGNIGNGNYGSAGYGYGGYGQQCYGVYYYQGYSGYQPVQCNGMNCSGYTLANQQGQTVMCM